MIDQGSDYPAYAPSVLLDQAFDRIARAAQEFRLELLFGAGMSKSRGIPDGRALARQLVRTYFRAPGKALTKKEVLRLCRSFPLEAIAQAVEGRPGKGRSDLTALVRRMMVRKRPHPGKAHDLFLSVCLGDEDWNPAVKRVFTTNFDLLLEGALAGRGLTIHRDNFPEIRTAERERRFTVIPVIHLHGVLEAHYQLTELNLFDSTYDPTHALFRSALAEADAFVFVGYSLTDPDFRALYMRYREEIAARDKHPKNEDKTTYVVAPCPDERAYSLGAAIWSARGALWIPMDAEQFFQRLRLFLDDRVGRRALASIRAKFGYKDAKLLRDGMRRVSETLCLDDDAALGFMHEVRRGFRSHS